MSDYYARPALDPETLDAIRRATEHQNGVQLFQAIWILYLVVQVFALMITPAICAKIIACARGHNDTIWFWVVLAFPPSILVLLALGEKKLVIPSAGSCERRYVSGTHTGTAPDARPVVNPPRGDSRAGEDRRWPPTA
jgi:hypothetical protein